MDGRNPLACNVRRCQKCNECSTEYVQWPRRVSHRPAQLQEEQIIEPAQIEEFIQLLPSSSRQIEIIIILVVLHFIPLVINLKLALLLKLLVSNYKHYVCFQYIVYFQ